MRFNNRGFDADDNSVSIPIFKLFGWVIILILFLSAVGGAIYALGWFGEAATVAREEFGPRAMLEKYEWFKNASASLDSHRANLDAYRARLASLKESYGETPRSQWDRTDKEDWNQWHTEALGIVATYNRLASEYNAQMAKFNWRFANAGELPEGATTPVPREYREYQLSL